MAKIDRYDGNLQAFASAALGTERTIFGDVTQANDLTSQINADFLRGWGIVGPSDQPALEDFNGAMYTHGQLLAYLHQIGVPEYSATQEYHIGSIANVAGLLYDSLINNNVGNTPASSPAAWRLKSAGQLIAVRPFTANTTYTPTAGTRFVIVEVQGGGGAGGGTPASGVGQYAIAPGGGAGGYAKALITAGFSGASIVVGSGGVPVLSGAGGAGGSSSFGAFASGSGAGGGGAGSLFTTTGLLGSGNNRGSGSVTASATCISLVAARGSSGPPATGIAPTAFVSGYGGASFYGGGGDAVITNSLPGGAGASPGSGGAGGAQGASTAGQIGGAGAPGLVTVWEYA